MKKRNKTLTAILLAAAMTVSSLSTGFAADTVSGDNTGLEDELPEGVLTEIEDTDDLTVSGDGEEFTVPEDGDSDEEFIDEGGDLNTEAGDASGETVEEEQVSEDFAADALTEEDPETDTVTEEVSETVPPEEAVTDAPNEETSFKLSESEHTFYTIEKKKEYDGKPFSSSYTVPGGYKLLSENNYQSPMVASENEVFTFPGIKTVSQSATYYVYKKDADNNDAFDYKVEIKITKRPVTFRSYTWTKVEDGKPLSQSSNEGASSPDGEGASASAKVVKGSMVAGESFKFIFDSGASITTGTNADYSSVKNTFKVSENGTAELNNYDVSYEYGDLILSKGRGEINGLDTPTKVKAVMDKKGAVKITWKKVVSYKSNGKKGGKTEYKVARYRSDGTWETLTDGINKTKYVDISPKKGEMLIYRIIAKGIDSSGKSGECKDPAYTRITPYIVSVTPYDGVHYARINFAGLGGAADTYTLRHWNTKSKSRVDDLTISRFDAEPSVYEGKTRTVSTCSYLDAGGSNVTISGNNKATFVFKVKADKTTVLDFGEKKTLEETPWSKAVKLKMESLSPYLYGNWKSRGAFTLKWTKIKKATGYLIEYCRDDTFSAANTKTAYVGKDKRVSDFEKREYDVSNVEYGVPYYCRVTAYLKKKGDASEYGIPLGTSQVEVEYGRQKAVQNLSAEYYEDGDYRCEARLSWTDNQEQISGYYVQKWTYEYDSSIKGYVLKGHEVLQDYKKKTDRKSYVNTTENRVVNGDLIRYRVQSVSNREDNRLGENRDGYVFSEPAEFFYMNPREFIFKKNKYTVKVGEKLKPDYKFLPKQLPKTIAGLTKEQFKEVYGCYLDDKSISLFNKDLEFRLESDDMNGDGIKKYVTVDGTDGELKGIKEYKKNYIILKASSPNDPYNVYDTAIVQVAPSDGTTEEEKERPKNKLVVCLDPGHGGSDQGTVHNGIVESKMNLTIAKALKKQLEKEGATVYMTRTEDKKVSLTDRTDYADDKNCNLFISLHCNYNSDSSKRGTEVYYSLAEGMGKKKLAKKISKAVADALGTVTNGGDEGAKTRKGDNGDYYSVIRTSAAKGIPGLIVEHAFVSNTADANALKALESDEEKLTKLAKAEAEAIIDNWK